MWVTELREIVTDICQFTLQYIKKDTNEQLIKRHCGPGPKRSRAKAVLSLWSWSASHSQPKDELINMETLKTHCLGFWWRLHYVSTIKSLALSPPQRFLSRMESLNLLIMLSSFWSYLKTLLAFKMTLLSFKRFQES